MKKIVSIILITSLMVLGGGCSNNSQEAKKENERLKSLISQLEKDINDKNSKIIELQNKEIDELTINYTKNMYKKRLVEKRCDLLALPVDNTLALNSILDNTVVNVLDTAYVNNIVWFYISIPDQNNHANYKGWIKETDTALYIDDKDNKF